MSSRLKLPNEVQAFLSLLFESDDEVVQPHRQASRFGSRGFRVAGQVFAMPSGGELALKLPSDRVDSLIAEGKGVRLDMGGRPIKGWIVITDRATWPVFAQEARDFVRNHRKQPE